MGKEETNELHLELVAFDMNFLLHWYCINWEYLSMNVQLDPEM